MNDYLQRKAASPDQEIDKLRSEVGRYEPLIAAQLYLARKYILLPELSKSCLSAYYILFMNCDYMNARLCNLEKDDEGYKKYIIHANAIDECLKSLKTENVNQFVSQIIFGSEDTD